MTALSLWADILDGVVTPDAETCVHAAALLQPTYVTVNIHEVRDAVLHHMGTENAGPPLQGDADPHYLRMLHVSDMLDAVAPDAPGRAEVEVLTAWAALNDIRSAESWATNGDVARMHLNAALTIEPGHTLALLVLHTQHVSGGVA